MDEIGELGENGRRWETVGPGATKWKKVAIRATSKSQLIRPSKAKPSRFRHAGSGKPAAYKPDTRFLADRMNHVHVTRTPHGVDLKPKKVAVSGGALRSKVSVQIEQGSKISAPEKILLLAVSMAVDSVAAIPSEDAVGILKRVEEQMKQRKLLLFSDFLLDGASTSENDAMPVQNKAALERAFKRAERSKTEILKQPDMLNGEQLADKLGTVRATVDNRRVANKLLALDFGTKRGVRYPEWQVELLQDAEKRSAYEHTLGILGTRAAWEKYRFFTQASPMVGGKTPIEAIKAGKQELVFRAAEAWARGEQGGG